MVVIFLYSELKKLLTRPWVHPAVRGCRDPARRGALHAHSPTSLSKASGGSHSGEEVTLFSHAFTQLAGLLSGKFFSAEDKTMVNGQEDFESFPFHS